MTDERRVTVSPDLANNPNYLAYKAMEAELKEKYMGKWVAFHDGRLAVIADNEEELFQKAQEVGIGGFYVHEITEVERVYHLRSPRLVRPKRR